MYRPSEISINDGDFHIYLTKWLLYILSPSIFLLLLFVIPAPYGKHFTTRPSLTSPLSSNIYWGPSLNARLSWFLFETPNLLWSYYCFRHRRRDVFNSSPANIVLLSLFVMHYVNRCIIYPLRMTTGSQPVNMATILSAFCCCALNGLWVSIGLIGTCCNIKFLCVHVALKWRLYRDLSNCILFHAGC